jgi:predicted HicB family RNase H-like nuclease
MVTKAEKKSNSLFTYRVTWSEEDQEYVGLCAEFPSLSWLADTQEAALRGINEVVAGVIEDMESNGETPPEPLSKKQFSGKFTVRVPAEVHRKLAIRAAESKVSFNRYISAKLSSD